MMTKTRFVLLTVATVVVISTTYTKTLVQSTKTTETTKIDDFLFDKETQARLMLATSDQPDDADRTLKGNAGDASIQNSPGNPTSGGGQGGGSGNDGYCCQEGCLNCDTSGSTRQECWDDCKHFIFDIGAGQVNCQSPPNGQCKDKGSDGDSDGDSNGDGDDTSATDISGGKPPCPGLRASTSASSAAFVDREWHDNSCSDIKGGKSGAWVCRTVTDDVTGQEQTFSACVSSGKFLESDQRGCCGTTCPDVCSCTCQRQGGLNGFLIEKEGDSTCLKCYELNGAFRKIANSGYKCATSC